MNETGDWDTSTLGQMAKLKSKRMSQSYKPAGHYGLIEHFLREVSKTLDTDSHEKQSWDTKPKLPKPEVTEDEISMLAAIAVLKAGSTVQQFYREKSIQGDGFNMDKWVYEHMTQQRRKKR